MNEIETVELHQDGDIQCVSKSFLHPSTPVSDNLRNISNLRRRCTCDSISSKLGLYRNWDCKLHHFADQVEHVATETFLLTALTIKLLRYLGVGYKWITAFCWLMLYAFLLLPGFLKGMWYYFLSGRVLRSICYGDKPRNTLDLYMPSNPITSPKPVVIFVTGGAWIIGYKAWGALLGWALADNEIIVASIDYRNFPQALVGEMVEDVSRGISWVFRNIANYGGDPSRIFLVSQSAGAHLSCLALLQAAKAESEGEAADDVASWQPSKLKAFVGVSGPFEMSSLVEHFHKRGLYRSIFLRIMEGRHSLSKYSPTTLVNTPQYKKAVKYLPAFTLYHGTADISVPFSSSDLFAASLSKAGVNVQLRLLDNKTHTDLIIQDLMRGGKDELLEDIVCMVFGVHTVERLGTSVERKQMLPEVILQLARLASPF